MPLDRIGTREIDAYVCKKSGERSKRTGKPLSASSIANHLGLLRRILKVAHRWEMITRVPDIQPPRKGTVDTYLSREETRALIKSAEPLFRDLLLVAVRTGLRVGELRELRASDIDLAGARIRVSRQRTQEGKVTAPKYGKSRTVLVPSDALESCASACRISDWVSSCSPNRRATRLHIAPSKPLAAASRGRTRNSTTLSSAPVRRPGSSAASASTRCDTPSLPMR
jgi:integrase